jgi:hypothetical protein
MSHSKHPKTVRITKGAKARIKAGVSKPIKGTSSDPYTISGLRKDLFNAVDKADKTSKPVFAKGRGEEGAEVVLLSKAAYAALINL